jgi:Domain of unknown function (DUF6457)
VSVLDQWLDDVVAALGLDPAAFDRDLLLDLTRDVAHGVARPAAPLTAYLAGLAVAAEGGGRERLEDVVRRISNLIPDPSGDAPVR